MDAQDELKPETGDDAVSSLPPTSGDELPQEQPEGSRSSTNPGLNLTRIRDLIIMAHEDVVPELVVGETFDELLASIEPARQAFQQVVERIVRPAPRPGQIPAGQPGRSATRDSETASLNPGAKIAEGLRRRTG